jgi:hypothetical protein
MLLVEIMLSAQEAGADGLMTIELIVKQQPSGSFREEGERDK